MSDETIKPRPSHWRNVFIALIILGATLLCVVGGSAFLRGSEQPTNWRPPPLYPGAQNVNEQDYGRGQAVPGNPNMYLVHLTTFSVADPPEKVKEYYRRAYAAGSWRPSDWGRVKDLSDRLNYRTVSVGHSPTIYFLDVITRPAPGGGTDVEIGSSVYPGS